MAGQRGKQSPGAKPGFFYGYIIVVAAFCIMVAMWGAYLSFGVFFKPLINEFGWTRAMTSGAFSLSMIISGLLGIVMGVLTDRLGPRLVMTFCGFFFGLGHILMSQVGSVWQLYLFYGVIIGTGMSSVMVSLLSTVAKWFTKRRSLMTGVVLTGSGICSLIAPPVATWLIFTYGWRMSYIIVGCVVIVIATSASQFLRRDPAQMALVPYGESEEEREWKAGVEGFSLKEAVYTVQLWLVLGLNFCFGICMFALIVHIVPHATDMGMSASGAANILAIIGGMVVVGRIVLGHAADKIGNKQVFIIGFILTSAASFWLVSAAEMWRLYLFAVVFGFAHGGMGVSESPLVAELFGLSSHGLIFGAAILGFTIGAAIGPLLAGYIFDVTGSYQVAFLVCASAGIVGLALTMLVRPIRGKHK